MPDAGDPLGLAAPCEIAASVAHPAHRSPEGTWPNTSYKAKEA